LKLNSAALTTIAGTGRATFDVDDRFGRRSGRKLPQETMRSA